MRRHILDMMIYKNLLDYEINMKEELQSYDKSKNNL